MLFSPIKKRYISDIVFEQLRDNIYRGDIKAGEKLISEREIASILKVSHSSVKKAIVRLIKMGYVEKRQGVGNFVKLPEACSLHNPFSHIMASDESSLDELLDVRIGLECYGVALAAERAVTEDMISLKQALSELTNGQLTQQEAKDADINFHMAIAYATHNSVHIDLMWRFYNYMFHGVDELYSLLYEKNNTFRIIGIQHYKILEAPVPRCQKLKTIYVTAHCVFAELSSNDR